MRYSCHSWLFHSRSPCYALSATIKYLDGVLEVIVYRGMEAMEQNRGFCFVEFADHSFAEAAHKCVSMVLRARAKGEASNKLGTLLSEISS